MRYSCSSKTTQCYECTIYRWMMINSFGWLCCGRLWGWIIRAMKGQRFRITFQQQNTLRISSVHRILLTGRQTDIVDRPCRIQFANILRRFIATKHKHIGPLTRVDMLLIRYIVEALIWWMMMVVGRVLLFQHSQTKGTSTGNGMLRSLFQETLLPIFPPPPS